LELHLRRFKRIVRREMNGDKKYSAAVRAIARTHDCSLYRDI
jgi:hypothetical protein